MNFNISKYKNISLIPPIDNIDNSFLISAIKLIEKSGLEYKKYLAYVDNILIGQYHKGDAIASSFVEEKTIVITPYNTEDTEFIASILVHELTHMGHYQNDPDDYLNQENAEKVAFDNEIKFLENIGNQELANESKKIRDNLLSYLKTNKTTAGQSEESLKKQDSNMSYHQEMMDYYFNN